MDECRGRDNAPNVQKLLNLQKLMTSRACELLLKFWGKRLKDDMKKIYDYHPMYEPCHYLPFSEPPFM